MVSQEDLAEEVARRKKEVLGPLFQFVGVLDIVMGIFFAFGLNYLMGEDPDLQPVLYIVGAVLVASGVGFWLWGRHIVKKAAREYGPTVVRNR